MIKLSEDQKTLYNELTMSEKAAILLIQLFGKNVPYRI